jgi:hypothetical protein
VPTFPSAADVRRIDIYKSGVGPRPIDDSLIDQEDGWGDMNACSGTLHVWDACKDLQL